MRSAAMTNLLIDSAIRITLALVLVGGTVGQGLRLPRPIARAAGISWVVGRWAAMAIVRPFPGARRSRRCRLRHAPPHLSRSSRRDLNLGGL